MIDLGRFRRTVFELAVGVRLTVHHGHLLRRLQAAALDAADADASDIRRVVERRNLQLQRAVDFVGVRGRHVFENRVEHRTHVGRRLGQVERRIAVQRRRVDDRKIELLVGRAELVEQIEGVIDDPVRTRAVTIDLVDHDDRLQSERQRLLGHEARLRHRTFYGVDQQQNAVDHRQHALDLAAEVGVSRRIDDVDVYALVIDGEILGENRDPPFLFQVVRIHDPFSDVLVRGEAAGLMQQLIDERGLAVVDVGNDGDVTYGTGHGRLTS